MLQEHVVRASLRALRLWTIGVLIVLIAVPPTLLHAQEATPHTDPQSQQPGSITILSTDETPTLQFEVINDSGAVLETGPISGNYHESPLLVSTPGSTAYLTLRDLDGSSIAQAETIATADGSLHFSVDVPSISITAHTSLEPRQQESLATTAQDSVDFAVVLKSDTSGNSVYRHRVHLLVGEEIVQSQLTDESGTANFMVESGTYSIKVDPYGNHFGTTVDNVVIDATTKTYPITLSRNLQASIVTVQAETVRNDSPLITIINGDGYVIAEGPLPGGTQGKTFAISQGTNYTIIIAGNERWERSVRSGIAVQSRNLVFKLAQNGRNQANIFVSISVPPTYSLPENAQIVFSVPDWEKEFVITSESGVMEQLLVFVPGTVEYRLSAPGYVDVVGSLQIQANATGTIQVELTPIESPIETPEVTPSETPTETPVVTPSETPTETPAVTPSETPTETPEVTPSETPTETPEVTPSETPTETPVVTPSETPTETPVVTPSETPTETPEVTPSETPTETPVVTPSETPTETPEVTPSETPTETPVVTPSETPSETPEVTPSETPTETPEVTPSETPTETPEVTPSETPEVTPSETPTETPVVIPSETPTETPVVTPSETPTETPDVTPSETPTETPEVTPSETPTETPEVTPSETPTETPEVTPSETPTETPEVTPSETPTETPVVTPSETPTETPEVTPSETPTETPVVTPSETPTETPEVTPSETPTETPEVTPSETPTETAEVTPSETPTETPAVTPSETPTETPEVTPSETPTETPEVTPSETPDVAPTRILTIQIEMPADQDIAGAPWRFYAPTAAQFMVDPYLTGQVESGNVITISGLLPASYRIVVEPHNQPAIDVVLAVSNDEVTEALVILDDAGNITVSYGGVVHPTPTTPGQTDQKPDGTSGQDQAIPSVDTDTSSSQVVTGLPQTGTGPWPGSYWSTIVMAVASVLATLLITISIRKPATE